MVTTYSKVPDQVPNRASVIEATETSALAETAPDLRLEAHVSSATTSPATGAVDELQLLSQYSNF